jgi:hypothetical protein
MRLDTFSDAPRGRLPCFLQAAFGTLRDVETMRRHRLILALLVVLVSASCVGKGDADGLALLQAQVPEFETGVLYLSVDVDGACTTDCPPAAISRGIVVPCSDLAEALAAYEALVSSAGFSVASDEEWTKTADDRRIILNVFAYDDASIGPQPTEQPFVDSPDDLVGACAVVVIASFEA